MASNKRLLKKEIRTICGALAGECVVAKFTIPEIDNKKLDSVILELADLQQNALSRANFDFPQTAKSFSNAGEYRKNRRTYFKAGYGKLKSEFNAHIDAIIKKMNEALPEKQKEANKQAAKA